MKYKGLLADSLSGSLGAIVASSNTAGSYFRRKVLGTNPNTLAQNASRTAFTLATQAFRGLAANKQATWNMVGASVNLKANAFYVGVNAFRRGVGLPSLDTPPNTADPIGLTAPTVAIASTGTATITFAGSDSWKASGGACLIQISPPLSPGQEYNNRWRRQAVYLGSATAAYAGATAVSVSTGDRVRFRFTAGNPDGRMSNRVEVEAVVG